MSSFEERLTALNVDLTFVGLIALVDPPKQIPHTPSPSVDVQEFALWSSMVRNFSKKKTN